MKPVATEAIRSHASAHRAAAPNAVASRMPTRTASRVTVAKGDTLSEIVARRLRGLGERVTTEAIYSGVARVASDNGIANPDLIFAGQRIDISTLDAGQGDRSFQSLLHRESNTHRADAPRRISKDAAPGHAAKETAPPPPARFRETAAPPLVARTTTPSEPHLDAVPAPASPWRTILGAPARLTSAFGMRTNPFTGHRDRHAGIDLAAAHGTTVYPIRSGKVIQSGWADGYGYTVVVRHADGSESLYGHNSRNLVAAGDTVSDDTPLARVGSTGRSTGPHLHFELRVNGRPVDPVARLAHRAYLETTGG